MLVRRIGGWADDAGLQKYLYPDDQASRDADAMEAISRKQKRAGRSRWRLRRPESGRSCRSGPGPRVLTLNTEAPPVFLDTD